MEAADDKVFPPFINLHVMLNTMVVAAVTNFSGTTTPDKNGEMPIMLQGIAGVMPNRNVLSGTVGKRSGLEVGRTYLLLVREVGIDTTFGQDFNFTKVMELSSAFDIVRAAKELGDAKLMVIPRPEGFEKAYIRKGDAVESVRTQREKQGLYKRTIASGNISHETAAEVLSGSSNEPSGEILHEGRTMA